MISATSLDEAWGEAPEPEPPKLAPGPKAPRSPPSTPPASPPRPGRHSFDTDLTTCVSALEQVSGELRDLKALFTRQQAEQKTVLYVAIVVVVMLLLFTAHSYSRLQFASDCMLHLRK